MIHTGMLFIGFALVLYTTAVWAEHFKKKLKLWIVITFGSGFIFDLIGTSIMFMIAKQNLILGATHSIFGYIALGIMFLHLIWAILAILKVRKCEQYFTKFSVFAWGFWLLTFLTGIPIVFNWFIKVLIFLGISH